MDITFDPAKRKTTLAERGLDFADAGRVFAGVTLEVEALEELVKRASSATVSGRPDGGRGLHAAWRGSPHLQHEESQ
jgi:uncharacterized DUF497 family protein